MSQRPRVHGRDHRPGGADPIPGFGDFLHFGTNDDTSSLGLVINADGSININDGTGASFQTGFDGSITVTGAAETVVQGPDVQITGLGAGALVTLQAGSLHTVKLDEATKITTLQLPTSGAVQVKDHTGAVIFQVDEDGDVHILTGKTITADL